MFIVAYFLVLTHGLLLLNGHTVADILGEENTKQFRENPTAARLLIMRGGLFDITTWTSLPVHVRNMLLLHLRAAHRLHKLAGASLRLHRP